MRVERLLVGDRDLFEEWLDRLSPEAEAEVLKYVRRIENGNLKSLKSVGGGVYEIRIFFPTKLRVYCGYESAQELLTILGGEEKGQSNDIREAKRIWREYKNSKK